MLHLEMVKQSNNKEGFAMAAFTRGGTDSPSKSRLGYLARNPKRSLSALGTLLVAAGLTVGSGAYFTDTDSSLSNTAGAAEFGITMFGSSDPSFDAYSCDADTAGNLCADPGLSEENDSPNTTFTVSRLVPSNSRTYSRKFSVKNDSDVPAKVRVKAFEVEPSSGALLNAVQASVSRSIGAANSAPLTDGKLTDLNDAYELAVGETAVYTLTLKLPSDGDQTTALSNKDLSVALKAVANDTNAGTPDTGFSLNP